MEETSGIECAEVLERCRQTGIKMSERGRLDELFGSEAKKSIEEVLGVS